jgi:hypothetical protein
MTVMQAGLALLILSFVLRQAARRRPGDPVWCIVARAAATGLAAWLLIGAGMAAVPPLADLRVRVVESGPGMLLLEVYATRRGDCQFRRNDSFVIDGDNLMHGAAVVYRGAGALANRPPGRQRLSDRVLYFRADVVPVAVRFVAHHDCGLLWRDVASDSGRIELWQ